VQSPHSNKSPLGGDNDDRKRHKETHRSFACLFTRSEIITLFVSWYCSDDRL